MPLLNIKLFAKVSTSHLVGAWGVVHTALMYMYTHTHTPHTHHNKAQDKFLSFLAMFLY